MLHATHVGVLLVAWFVGGTNSQVRVVTKPSVIHSWNKKSWGLAPSDAKVPDRLIANLKSALVEFKEDETWDRIASTTERINKEGSDVDDCMLQLSTSFMHRWSDAMAPINKKTPLWTNEFSHEGFKHLTGEISAQLTNYSLKLQNINEPVSYFFLLFRNAATGHTSS
jgi:hypothetical protein